MQLCNLEGRRFGYLSVVRFSHSHNGHTYWFCICDCGKDIVVRGSHLKSGHSVSCGCKRGNISHQESKTRLYHIWNGMRERCSNSKNPQYDSYGARGIRVCSDWLSYVNFRDWSLANGYAENLSIDRIDNNGGYSPENCRWATAREQANNTRKTRFITYNGETHSISEWARKLGIKQSTLSMRINKYGWNAEDAFGKEVKKYGS